MRPTRRYSAWPRPRPGHRRRATARAPRLPPEDREARRPGADWDAVLARTRRCAPSPAEGSGTVRSRTRARTHSGSLSARRGASMAAHGSEPLPHGKSRAVSSAGERFPDTEEATSSNLVPPTRQNTFPGPQKSGIWPSNCEGQGRKVRLINAPVRVQPGPPPHTRRPPGARSPGVFVCLGAVKRLRPPQCPPGRRDGSRPRSWP
jgi:hypothetical protein